jgi:HAD superfamily hydrolase (TIGR01509 family)
MALLDGIQVACFDLFDTLIRVRAERLPQTEVGGTRIHSTIPILHERLFAERGIALDELTAALREVWTELRSELKAEDRPEDERLKEIPAIAKYRRLLDRLEGIDDAEVDGLAEDIAELHHASLVGVSEAMEGAAELLDAVRAHGIPTALISNWDHARAGRAMLEATGLAGRLDHVVISEAVGLRKPHRRLFELALEPFDAPPGAALHVGDLAEADAWGAGRLGFRTVWIDRAGEGWPAALEARPTLTVSRLADLLGHV